MDKLLPSTTLHDPNPISPFVFFDAPLASSASRAALASLGVLVNTTIASNIDEIVRRRNTWALLAGDDTLWRLQPDRVSDKRPSNQRIAYSQLSPLGRHTMLFDGMRVGAPSRTSGSKRKSLFRKQSPWIAGVLVGPCRGIPGGIDQ